MDQKSIEEIYKKFSTPDHVIRHMQKVAYVCGKIADMMLEKGIAIDKELVITAALLHDTLRTIPHHEEAMAKFLSSQGKKALANLVKKHGFFSVDELKTWEEKILYYADKRVNHDQIVSLKQRFLEGKKRSSVLNDNSEKVRSTEEKVFGLEQEIVKALGKRIDKF